MNFNVLSFICLLLSVPAFLFMIFYMMIMYV